MTGAWSEKAIAEAKRYGRVHEAALVDGRRTTTASRARPRSAGRSGRSTRTSPRTTPSSARSGRASRRRPRASGSPATRRATSSRGRSTSRRYGVLYAGAQKNIGPAGVTLRDRATDLRRAPVRELPTMLRYAHAREGGLALQHAADLRHLRDGARVPVDPAAGRARGDGAAEPREGAGCSTTRSTAHDFYAAHARRGQPLADERHLPHAEHGARRALREGGARRRASSGSRATARWAACARASTTRSRGGLRGARQLHEGLRREERLTPGRSSRR